ncbi:hypothetical protein Tco_0320665 [Tanacetum coccineum]
MIKPEPVKKLSKKDQLKLDEEVAQRLQAEFDEQERIEREKAEKEAKVNIALKETWDDIQAKIDADCLLAKRLQAREQEEQDLEDLYNLVKDKYGSTRPMEDLDLILYGDLKIMFDPHVENQGRIVGIKRLHDDLEVTAAKVAWRSGGDDVVDVMDLRWRRGGDDVVDRRWLVMEEGDDGSGGGWLEFGRSGAGYL